MDSSVTFSLLSAAFVLAAFMPMLIYTFSKGLFEDIRHEIEKNKMSPAEIEEIRKKANKAFYFYSAMDFIVTQSAILVFLSALIAVTIYLTLPISISQQVVKAGTTPCKYSLCKYCLIVFFLAYVMFAIVWSCYKLIDYYVKEGKGEWPDFWKFGLLFYSVITVYTILGIAFSLKLTPDLIISLKCFKWIISITFIMLTFFAVSWIIPAWKYTPLWVIKKNLSQKLKLKKENRTENDSATGSQGDNC